MPMEEVNTEKYPKDTPLKANKQFQGGTLVDQFLASHSFFPGKE